MLMYCGELTICLIIYVKLIILHFEWEDQETKCAPFS